MVKKGLTDERDLYYLGVEWCGLFGWMGISEWDSMFGKMFTL